MIRGEWWIKDIVVIDNGVSHKYMGYMDGYYLFKSVNDDSVKKMSYDELKESSIKELTDCLAYMMIDGTLYRYMGSQDEYLLFQNIYKKDKVIKRTYNELLEQDDWRAGW